MTENKLWSIKSKHNKGSGKVPKKKYNQDKLNNTSSSSMSEQEAHRTNWRSDYWGIHRRCTLNKKLSYSCQPGKVPALEHPLLIATVRNFLCRHSNRTSKGIGREERTEASSPEDWGLRRQLGGNITRLKLQLVLKMLLLLMQGSWPLKQRPLSHGGKNESRSATGIKSSASILC